MSQGYGHVGGHSSCLQRGVHQWFPQHWLSTESSSCTRSQAPNTTSHVSVVLYQMLLHDATAAAWTRLRAFPLQYRILFADAPKPVHGHRLKSPAHHWELLKHRIEVVHAERVEATIGVSPYTGCSPTSSQQADLPKVGSISEAGRGRHVPAHSAARAG